MNVNEFKAALKGGGARANMFEVVINFPAAAGGSDETQLLRFLVKATQLPSSVLGVIEQPFQGRILKIGGDRTFPEWTVTVINDSDFKVRDAFERWSNAINSHDGNQSLVSMEDTMTVASVFQLDKQHNRIKEYTYHDLWVSEIGNIELAQDTNNAIEEYTVTFQYSMWTSNTTS